MTAQASGTAVSVRLLETLVARLAPHQPAPPLVRLALRLLSSPLFDRPPLPRSAPPSSPSYQALIQRLNDLSPSLASPILRLLSALEGSAFPPSVASLPHAPVPAVFALPVVIATPSLTSRPSAVDWQGTVALDALHAAQGLASARAERQGTTLVPRNGVFVEGNARLDALFRVCANAGSAVLSLEADLSHSAPVASLAAQAMTAALRSHFTSALAPLRSLRSASAGVSLCRVAALSLRLTPRLGTLSSALRLCASLRGIALCNALHTTLQSTADPELRSLYLDLLRAASAPLLRQMSSALLEGSFADAHAEAILVLNANAQQWTDLCALRAGATPSWLPVSLLERLVAAVRALLFLRIWSRDLVWLEALRSGPLASALSPASSSLLYPCTDLTSALDAYAAQLENRAAASIRAADAEEQLRHCHLCLALTSAPFASALLSAHIAHNPNPSAAFTAARPRLLAALDDAARSAGLPLAIAARLDVLLLSGDPSAFALAYNADAPLSLLLSPSAMSAYVPPFRLLWSVRRLEALLYITFKNLGRSPHRRPAGLVTHTLIVFVRALLSLCHSHLAPAAATLLRSVASASSVDQLLAAHTQYLKAIQPTAMLPAGAQLPLQELLEQGEAWCNAQAGQSALEERRAAVIRIQTHTQAKGAARKGRRAIEVHAEDGEDEQQERGHLSASASAARSAIARCSTALRLALASHLGPLSALADLLLPLAV